MVNVSIETYTENGTRIVNSHHYLYPHLNSTPDHPPPPKKIVYDNKV